MGLLHIILNKLRKTLSEIEQNPSPDNINKFHAEVFEKLEILNKELEHTKFLANDSSLIAQRLHSIKSSFEAMVFLKDEVESQSPKALRNEIQNFKTNINKISEGLDWVRKNIKALEKVIQLIKVEEKAQEQ